MPDLVKFAAFVLVYFLIVYLTAIRRGGQQLLPWVLLILVQALSVFYYQKVLGIVKQFPFLAQMTVTTCKIITVSCLVLANLLLILLVNMLFQERETITEKDDYVVDVADIPFVWEPTDVQMRVDVPQTIEFEDMSTGSQEPADDFNIDDGTIIDTIHELSKNGNHEEAMKYLRMVVYFGKNDVIVEQAKNMLKDMQEERE